MDVTGWELSTNTCGTGAALDSEFAEGGDADADGTILPNLCPDPVNDASIK